MTNFLSNRVFWLKVLTTLGLAGLGAWQLVAKLAPCQPLDRYLQRSGCFQTITVNSEELQSPFFLLQSFTGSTPYQPHAQPFAFSPTGELIAIPGIVETQDEARRPKNGIAIALVNTNSGTLRQSFLADETYYSLSKPPGALLPISGSFSLDETLFAAHVKYEDITATYLWNVSNGERLWRVPVHACNHMTFAVDNQHLICDERKIRISDGIVLNLTEDDQQALVTQTPSGDPIGRGSSDVVSPDRTFKVVVRLSENSNDRFMVDIQPLDDASTPDTTGLELLSEQQFPRWIYISPDSELLVIKGRNRRAQTETITIWRRDGTVLKHFELDGHLHGAIWSPDSQVLAVGLDDTVQLYNVNEGLVYF